MRAVIAADVSYTVIAESEEPRPGSAPDIHHTERGDELCDYGRNDPGRVE
jgi:hypothetical protein